ncbi:hypothetical protein [Candidatus Tisiphia endosymbiont of Micropterix aruncella]|uniref:hypothetical protein n=1 Tax=Candidatus Tisiphia endosymbiont of Micropterix aruncella TaxID=3066271 RepID=UPI003AA8AEFB
MKQNMQLPKDSKTKVMKTISKAKASKEVTSSASKSLKFPVDWSPYPFQLPLWRYLYSGGKKAIAIWHRRAGKDIMGINWITASAIREVGIYWYVYPTYNQAKMSVWDGMTLSGRPYMSFIPDGVIARSQQYKQRILFKNGSVIQFVGSDRYASIRGSGIKGAVISEYSYHDPRAMSCVIEPMVVRNNAWLLYLYTPSDNPKLTHGEELYIKYQNSPGVFCQIRTIEDTTDHEGKPLVEKSKLDSVDMTDEEIRREFYCDFEAYRYKRADQGGTFVEQLRLAESQGRIGYVPYDPAYQVHTYWDIGIVDYTVIWFVQEKQDYIDIIDFYMNRGKDLEFYLNHLRTRPYQYGRNVLPHDMSRRQMPTLDTRLQQANEVAEKVGFSPFAIGRKYLREEMITKARILLGKCRIDAQKCQRGINGLFEFDATKRGVHSNSSRATDITESFCYMAMDVKTGDEQQQSQYDIVQHRKVMNDYNALER